jgi:hypothetical protein
MSIKIGAIVGLIIGILPIIMTIVAFIFKLHASAVSMVFMFPVVGIGMIIGLLGIPELLGYVIWPAITIIIGMIIGHKLSH